VSVACGCGPLTFPLYAAAPWTAFNSRFRHPESHSRSTTTAALAEITHPSQRCDSSSSPNRGADGIYEEAFFVDGERAHFSNQTAKGAHVQELT
jgi:hypothetical protein